MKVEIGPLPNEDPGLGMAWKVEPSLIHILLKDCRSMQINANHIKSPNHRQGLFCQYLYFQ